MCPQEVAGDVAGHRQDWTRIGPTETATEESRSGATAVARLLVAAWTGIGIGIVPATAVVSRTPDDGVGLAAGAGSDTTTAPEMHRETEMGAAIEVGTVMRRGGSEVEAAIAGTGREIGRSGGIVGEIAVRVNAASSSVDCVTWIGTTPPFRPL